MRVDKEQTIHLYVHESVHILIERLKAEDIGKTLNMDGPG